MLGLIGGTGLSEIDGFELRGRLTIKTPFGSPSGELMMGRFHAADVLFLARHGERHTIPPHKINYRANVWALRDAGVKSVIAIAAVGGIRSDMAPGRIAIPDQIIDYTSGRCPTFFEKDLEKVTHIDFTHPYSKLIQSKMLEAANEAGINVVRNGTYGCTQGPRLETAAEIRRMEQDGCDIVGMTGMPEAALAREIELEYACCAVIANWAAGKSPGTISMEEILGNLRKGMQDIVRLLQFMLRIEG